MSTNQTIEIDCGVSTVDSSENSERFKDSKNKKSQGSDDETETLKTTNIVVVGRPKRPLSAYNLFFQEERRRLLSSRALAASNNRGSSSSKIGFAEMAKTIAAKWHTIDPESKSRYDAIAKQEKARHRRTIAEWKKINKENNNNGASFRLSSKKRKQMDPLISDIEQMEKLTSKKKKTSPKATTKAMAGVLEPCEPEQESASSSKDQQEKPTPVEPSPVAKPAPSPQIDPSPVEAIEPEIGPSPVETVARSSETVAPSSIEKAVPRSHVEAQQPSAPVQEAPSLLPTEVEPSPLPTEVARSLLPTEVAPSPLPTEVAPSPLPTEAAATVAPSPINQVQPTQFVEPAPVATFEVDEPNNELQRFAAYWGMAPMSSPVRVLATGPSAQPRMIIGLDRLVQDLKDLQSLDLFVDIFTTTNATTTTDGN